MKRAVRLILSSEYHKVHYSRQVFSRGSCMPRKKFNREEADKIWKNYSKNLVDSITATEKEGIEKGYSSYEIEKLWQDKVNKQEKSKSD